jgi:hypothetical protein
MHQFDHASGDRFHLVVDAFDRLGSSAQNLGRIVNDRQTSCVQWQLAYATLGRWHEPPRGRLTRSRILSNLTVFKASLEVIDTSATRLRQQPAQSLRTSVRQVMTKGSIVGTVLQEET